MSKFPQVEAVELREHMEWLDKTLSQTHLSWLEARERITELEALLAQHGIEVPEPLNNKIPLPRWEWGE